MKNQKDKEKTPPAIPRPEVKRRFSKKTILMSIFGGIGFIGVVAMVIYFVTQSMFLGGLGVFLAAIGGVGFYYAFKQEKELTTTYVGKVNKQQVNALVIYPHEVEFKDVYIKEKSGDGGFLWHCENDGKPYFVLWENPRSNNLEPFTLPDQQYCDPEVFAQRYLELPAHRKILKRKESLMMKLRPIFLIIGIIIVWVLIITTTGQKGEEVAAWVNQIPPII